MVTRRWSFEELAARPGDDLDLVLGATLIARDVHPDADPLAVRAELDALAEPLGAEGLEAAPCGEQAARLCELVHGSHGFSGNTAEYYDPRNSLVTDVLARRTGIPITLALVYTEIARRVGVRARGVGFPGHFLVRVDDALDHPVPGAVLDPFAGRVLDGRDLLDLARRVVGDAPLDPTLLAPATSRAILVRMLANLKSIHLERGDLARAHLAITRVTQLLPRSAPALRERGELALKLGARASALEDLERVVALADHTPDGERAKELLGSLGPTSPRVLN